MARLVDVPELLETPEPPGGRFELQAGRLFPVAFAKSGHYRLQRRLERLLQRLAEGFGEVGIEFAFRLFAHFELRAADVAYVVRARFEAVPPDDYLAGAPDLMIEVLSPSNRKGPLEDRIRLCLSNGCSEFWVVDSKQQAVTVFRSGTAGIRYALGDTIPLTLPAPGMLPVSEIFSA
jgi:Uma2 family endonuclease